MLRRPRVLAVITRELQAQSRQPATHVARAVVAGILLAVGLVYALNHEFAPDSGGALFSYLNFALFFAIWLVVPILAADCLSRERREGTLGLLFLTPLRPGDLVIAKSLVHGLRAFGLWLAVIPVLAVPLMMGGLGGREVMLSVMFNFSAVCWALAAGLLASSLSKRWLRAQFCAWVMAGAMLAAMFLLTGMTWNFVVSIYTPNRNWFPPFEGGFMLATDADACWEQILRARFLAKGANGAVIAAVVVTAFSLLVLPLSIRLAAGRIRRTWTEPGPSAAVARITRQLSRPVLMVPLLRRWLRRKLERNPIGWLEVRSWSGRSIMWAWFAILISVDSYVMGTDQPFRHLESAQAVLAWLLLGGMAVGAAGSFQRERENGVMELLLVSPLSVGQIIGGRLRGIWGQFLPAFILLFAIWGFASAAVPSGFYLFILLRLTPSLVMQMFLAFFAIPIIGLYFSLRRKTFIGALLWTLALGLVLPLIASQLAAWVPQFTRAWMLNGVTTTIVNGSTIWTSGPIPKPPWWMGISWRGWIIFYYVAVPIFLGIRLHRRLAQRQFDFNSNT